VREKHIEISKSKQRPASRVARRFRCLLGKKETENCILSSSSIRSSPKRRAHTYAYAHISVTLSTTRCMLLAETILHPCSIVDVTFASPDLLPFVGDWHMMEDTESLSDHLYISFKVKMSQNSLPRNKTRMRR